MAETVYSNEHFLRVFEIHAKILKKLKPDDNKINEYHDVGTEIINEYENLFKNGRIVVAAASCVCDIFRLFGTDNPFRQPNKLQKILLLIVKALRGLMYPKRPSYQHCLHILNNLNLCNIFAYAQRAEHPDVIFRELFKEVFEVINYINDEPIEEQITLMLLYLSKYANALSPKVLDIILEEMTRSNRSRNRNSYNLCRIILDRNLNVIYPFITQDIIRYILSKPQDSKIGIHQCQLIIEITNMSHKVIVPVLPTLHSELTNEDTHKRLRAIKIVAELCSLKNVESTIQQNLWPSYLKRFMDKDAEIRQKCVEYSPFIVKNQNTHTAVAMLRDLTKQLTERKYDTKQNVRLELVDAIFNLFENNLIDENHELVNVLKEYTSHRQFKTRARAYLALASLYQHSHAEKLSEWFCKVVFECYNRDEIPTEELNLLESIVHARFLPPNDPPEKRAHKMMELFDIILGDIEDHAVRGFIKMLNRQHETRQEMKLLMKCLESPENDHDLTEHITKLQNHLPNSPKPLEYLKSFCTTLELRPDLRRHLIAFLNCEVPCQQTKKTTMIILDEFGHNVENNRIRNVVRELLERVPVVVDVQCVREITKTDAGRYSPFLKILAVHYPDAFRERDEDMEEEDQSVMD